MLAGKLLVSVPTDLPHQLHWDGPNLHYPATSPLCLPVPWALCILSPDQ